MVKVFRIRHTAISGRDQIPTFGKPHNRKKKRKDANPDKNIEPKTEVNPEDMPVRRINKVQNSFSVWG